MLKCTTVRPGHECVFMTKSGCSYNGGACLTIIEDCQGCQRIVETESGSYCKSCPEPAMKWKVGPCNLATHITRQVAAQAKINPLKASRRASRGK
ncbi:MAG: PxxKW family cysteine-rich protein [Desulfatibacillaceae bacterium]